MAEDRVRRHSGVELRRMQGESTPNPGTVHIICGPTGAGKTTFARTLAKAHQAVRFSIDEWMANLFQKDTPETLTFDWAWERVQRCQNQIWQVCTPLLENGSSVVLDLGFTTRDHREQFRLLAETAGSAVTLHYVTADSNTRLDRVRKRNASQNEVFAFEVTDDMFDFMEDRFEEPEASEQAITTRTG